MPLSLMNQLRNAVDDNEWPEARRLIAILRNEKIIDTDLDFWESLVPPLSKPPKWFRLIFHRYSIKKQLFIALLESYEFYGAKWWWSDGRLGRALASCVIKSRRIKS